jgi:hypothetical protein
MELLDEAIVLISDYYEVKALSFSIYTHLILDSSSTLNGFRQKEHFHFV